MKKIKKALLNSCVTLFSIFTCISANAEANTNIADSKAATGTTKLIDDLTTWAMILAIPITILLVIYFAIRKSAADETDQKMWQKRITVAIVCGMFALAAASVINVIAGYYR